MDNYMKQERAGMRIQTLVSDRQIVTELSSDFTLPDYQPEIKRLLRVRATVLPADKYVGAGSADFSGTVDYTVLYCGNDGALYCTAQSEEYRFSAPMEGMADLEIAEGLVCDVDSAADLVTGRVTAPRKVSIKCRLRSQVRIRGTRTVGEEILGDGGESIERLMGSGESARVFVGMSEPFSLADEILPDAGGGELRVICADGQVQISEATAGSGQVNCRGEVAIKLLCAHEEQQAATVLLHRRIPFAESVPVDGAEVNCAACADGACTEMRVTVEEGRILCEVTVVLRAHAQRNEAISFTRDLYSTSAVSENEYTQLRVPIALGCVNGNVSVNTTLPLEEIGLRSGISVTDLAVTPTLTSMERVGGRYLLSGKCRCHVIVHDGEDYAAQEFEIPFRYEADGASAEIVEGDPVLTPIGCRAKADGERIHVDIELGVSICARGERTLRMLSTARFGEAVGQKGAVCKICYPSADDTLWSVSKRYHRPIESIAELNALAGSPAADSAESLAGVAYLLID